VSLRDLELAGSTLAAQHNPTQHNQTQPHQAHNQTNLQANGFTTSQNPLAASPFPTHLGITQYQQPAAHSALRIVLFRLHLQPAPQTNHFSESPPTVRVHSNHRIPPLLLKTTPRIALLRQRINAPNTKDNTNIGEASVDISKHIIPKKVSRRAPTAFTSLPCTQDTGGENLCTDIKDV
jgi:hypothetical protein